MEAQCQFQRPPFPKWHNKAQQGWFYINLFGFPNWTNQPGEAQQLSHLPGLLEYGHALEKSCADVQVNNCCIGGSVVEFSPTTWEARVRFLANAGLAFLLFFLQDSFSHRDAAGGAILPLQQPRML